jgi:hypothetical protein
MELLVTGFWIRTDGWPRGLYNGYHVYNLEGKKTLVERKYNVFYKLQIKD